MYKLGTLDSPAQLRKLFAAATPLFTPPSSPEGTVRRMLDDVWVASLADNFFETSAQRVPWQRLLLRATYLYSCCRPVQVYRPVAEEEKAARDVAFLTHAGGVNGLTELYVDNLSDGAHMLQEKDAACMFQASKPPTLDLQIYCTCMRCVTA